MIGMWATPEKQPLERIADALEKLVAIQEELNTKAQRSIKELTVMALDNIFGETRKDGDTL